MKRLRMVMKFVGLGMLALLAIGLIARAIADARASRQLDERLAKLRAAGMPTRIADLESHTIAPEKNAAVYLDQAREAVLEIDKRLADAYDHESKADQEAYDAGQPSAAMIQAIRDAFDEYPQVAPLLDKAAACPNYESNAGLHGTSVQFIDDVIDRLQPKKSFIRTLSYWAELQLANGQPQRAVETAIMMYRLCRHFDHEMAVIGFLVANGCRGLTTDILNQALRAGPIPDELHQAVDDELSHHDLYGAFRRSLVTERVVGLESIDFMFGNRFPILFFWLWPASYKWAQNDYLKFLDETDTATGEPYRDAIFELEKPHGMWAAMVQPSMVASLVVAHRVQAVLRCARLLNALSRYEQAHPGVEPKLSDLGLPEDATSDPFSGQPLIAKKLPEGWLIYSVNSNQKDDGGDFAELNDIGVGPIRLPSHQPEAQPRENND